MRKILLILMIFNHTNIKQKIQNKKYKTKNIKQKI